MAANTASFVQPRDRGRSADPNSAWVTVPAAGPPLAGAIRAPALLELSLSITGLLLAGFMVGHMALLFSILIGADAMNSVAVFLEDYYLLQVAAVFVVTFLLVHMFLAARKAPATFTQQWTMIRHMRGTRHLDTVTWAAQIISGIALVVLAAIHLWVILSDLPISADKSGTRVFQQYLWLYIPFILLVETHISFGLYRVAVKWGLLARRWAHPILLVWTAAFLTLGFAILVALYQEGA